jgi:hypothetical protein
MRDVVFGEVEEVFIAHKKYLHLPSIGYIRVQ